MKEPFIIRGGIGIDDRGSVSFVNDFNFEGVKRMYVIKNHRQGFVRAWHGHKKEAKWLYCTSGSVLVGAVFIDNWDAPSKNCVLKKFVLSHESPSILFIPEGYANGLMSLTHDATVTVFSSSTLDEAKGDDFRFPARHWDIWTVEER